MKTYTADQVREMLRSKLKTKTQLSLAEELGISPQHLSDVLKNRREPFGALLDYLGLERVVSYKKKRASFNGTDRHE